MDSDRDVAVSPSDIVMGVALADAVPIALDRRIAEVRHLSCIINTL